MATTPTIFSDRSRPGAAGPRYDRLSKADWALAYARLYEHLVRIGHLRGPFSAEAVIADAEARAKAAKTASKLP